MTIEEIKRTHDYHHTATRRGYVSRKSNGLAEPYSGKFGRGWIIKTPRWDTSQYCDYNYYVEREE